MHSTLDTISGIILILMATTAAAVAIEYLRRKYSPTYRAQAEARDKQRADTRTDWEARPTAAHARTSGCGGLPRGTCCSKKETD